VRIRAGPGFLHPIIGDDAPVIPVPASVTADEKRLLVHVRLDRAQMEARAGPHRFNTVIEIRLRGSQFRIAPDDSPAAQAGRWLLGKAPATVISPEAVRVIGPGGEYRVHAPLILAWSLVPGAGRGEQGTTWLQALAFVDVNEGQTASGMLQRPFATMYPGEPSVVDFDLEFERVR
ncbi:MAG TPA: hypothetical protein VLV15_00585, partial [Dongiaceae bacterium]|nr:hypothetical protein [Dongiaceae bacterium]